MFKSVFLATFCLLSVGLTGCGSMFNHHTVPLYISSEPPGAEVYVNGEHVGSTPVEVYVNNHRDQTVEIVSEDSDVTRCFVPSTVEGRWIVFNLFTGFLGYLVDGVTQNWRSLQYQDCHAFTAPY